MTVMGIGRDVAGVPLPESAAAQDAEQTLRSLAPWALYAHSLRSYVFASLIASRDGLHVDREALYVGCVLHDLGLTPAYEHPSRPFEQVSAVAAQALTARHGWEAARRATVGRSILLHMAAEVGEGESPEARALEAGVSLDVTGRGIADLGHSVVLEVCRALPRGPFKHDFSERLRSEAARKPSSATAVGVSAGLLDRVLAAPFDDTSAPASDPDLDCTSDGAPGLSDVRWRDA
jgi:HD domain